MKIFTSYDAIIKINSKFILKKKKKRKKKESIETDKDS